MLSVQVQDNHLHLTLNFARLLGFFVTLLAHCYLTTLEAMVIVVRKTYTALLHVKMHISDPPSSLSADFWHEIFQSDIDSD